MIKLLNFVARKINNLAILLWFRDAEEFLFLTILTTKDKEKRQKKTKELLYLAAKLKDCVALKEYLYDAFRVTEHSEVAAWKQASMSPDVLEILDFITPEEKKDVQTLYHIVKYGYRG